MARILYAWELGGGLGHLVHARTISEPLVRAGHEVVFVLRNPLPAVRVLGDLGRFMAAPLWPTLAGARKLEVFSYPSLLASLGYADVEALHCLALAWRHTIELVEPDIVLADHAPTALVGMRGLDIPTAAVGSGFFIPPTGFPMPHLRPWKPVPDADLAAFESQLTVSLNTALDRLGSPTVAGFGELFEGVGGLLLAYPEIDHYAHRAPGADYWGLPPPAVGARTTWPETAGKKRIFAYIKPFEAVEALLQALATSEASVIVYAPGLGAAVKQRHGSPSLKFLDHAADITQMAEECDLAISHGGIGTIAFMLLAGKPLLLLPLQLEQLLISQRVAEFGGGIVTTDHAVGVFRELLTTLLSSEGHRRAAQTFAARHPWPTTERFEAKLNTLVASMRTS